MRDNADIWQHVETLVPQRGAGSIAITKVKGHADQDDVAAGIITEENRIGNHHADTAADAAHQHHPRFLQDVLSLTVD